MSQEHNSPQIEDDEIDLAELWRAIWAGKYIIIAITFVFAVASVFYALSKPDVYKASVLLSPVSSQGGNGGLGALAGQFGGLASIAGINLGGATGDKTTLALSVLKSRSFIEKFIISHKLFFPLMTTKSWDMKSDALIINEDIYNNKTKQWVRDVKYPKKPKPSIWEAYQKFLKLLTVSQDEKTGIVTIEIEYYSPKLAKEWLTFLVKDINDFIKEQDQQEAKSSIAYLITQLEQTEIANMQTVFYQLIEEQSKNMMLTQIKQEYVLKTIDPAQVPEQKTNPKRGLIVIIGSILGGLFATVIILVRHFNNRRKF